MLLADFDLFFFWRRVLMIAGTIYTIIKLGQSCYTWYVTLRASGYIGLPGRRSRDYMPMARQYLLIQLLRVSPRRFIWDLLDLAILSAAMLALIFLHVPLEAMLTK